MNTKRRKIAGFVLVMSLFIISCSAGKLLEPTITPAPTPTLTSLPTHTPSPTPDANFLTLNVTNDLLNLLNKWNGKYVIFVNKDTDIKTLEDLNGKEIYCDMYTFGMETSVSDMSAFQKAAGVQMQIGLGNNFPQFFQQMSKNKNLVAFMPKTYADSKSLQDNPDYKIVLFK